MAPLILAGVLGARGDFKKEICMQGNRVRHIVGVAAVLTVGACENDSIKSDATAPEITEALGSTVSAAGAEVLRFRSKGPTATLFFASEEADGAVLFGDLQVDRAKSQGQQETFLFYIVQRCDPSGECVSVAEGAGLIPNGDFVVGRGEARLHTNISRDNSNFQLITGSGGQLSLQWKGTSAFTTNFHNQARTRSSGFGIEHFQSAGTFSSALAEGMVFGIGVNTFGQLGTMRTGVVIIFK